MPKEKEKPKSGVRKIAEDIFNSREFGMGATGLVLKAPFIAGQFEAGATEANKLAAKTAAKGLGKAFVVGDLALNAWDAYNLATDEKSRSEARAMVKGMEHSGAASRVVEGALNSADVIYGFGKEHQDMMESRAGAERSEVAYENMKARQITDGLNRAVDQEKEKEMRQRLGLERQQEPDPRQEAAVLIRNLRVRLGQL